MPTTSELENDITALKNAIDEGINNGIAMEFDPQQHLQSLKFLCIFVSFNTKRR